MEEFTDEFGGRYKTVTILRTDWGDVYLPDSASAAYTDVPKNRFGLPDRRTLLGRRLAAYEERQLRLANASRGAFTPEEFSTAD